MSPPAPTVALLFIDGVGVGKRDPAANPLARQPFLLSQFVDDEGEAVTPLPDGGRLFRVDPRFGVAGRPQSASNQTAILTARPAPALIGRHVLGFPDASLRAILAEHSIVRRLRDAGVPATFANGYPAAYLDVLGLPRRGGTQIDITIPARAKRRLKPSATTLAMAAGGVVLRTLDDVAAGEALTHDLDGGRGRRQGLALPAHDSMAAAEVFWRLAAPGGFTLFEHFLADEAGHAQDMEAALRALERFDGFAREVVRRKPAHAHVLICSDHGNVEDLSTRSHTLNDVPVLWFGPTATSPTPPLATVADVGRLVLSLLGAEAA